MSYTYAILETVLLAKMLSANLHIILKKITFLFNCLVSDMVPNYTDEQFCTFISIILIISIKR